MSAVEGLRPTMQSGFLGGCLAVALSIFVLAPSVGPTFAQVLTPSGQSLSRAANLPTDVDLISGSAANIYRDALKAIEECDPEKLRQALAALRIYDKQLSNITDQLVDLRAQMQKNEANILRQLANLIPDVDGTPLGPDGTGGADAVNELAKEVGKDLLKDIGKDIGKSLLDTEVKEALGPAGMVVGVINKIKEMEEKMKVAQEARDILSRAVLQALEVQLADLAINHARAARAQIGDWIAKLEALWDAKKCPQPTEAFNPGQKVAKETQIVDQSTQQIVPRGTGIFIPENGETIWKIPITKTGKTEIPQRTTDGGGNIPGEVIVRPQCHSKVAYDTANAPDQASTPGKPLRLFFRHRKCDELKFGDPKAHDLVNQALEDQYDMHLDTPAGNEAPVIEWTTTPLSQGMGDFKHDHCVVMVYSYRPTAHNLLAQLQDGPATPPVCLVPDRGRTTDGGGGRTTNGGGPHRDGGGGNQPVIPKDGPTDMGGGKTAEGDQPRGPEGPPLNDPFLRSKGTWGQPYPDQWYLKAINWLKDDGTTVLPAAGTLVTVAVIDTGLDITHPELLGATWLNPKPGPQGDRSGWNFVDNNADIRDLAGHGTHIAGIIAAASDNGFGIAGINPWARIMPLKALDFDGNGGSIGVAQAITYAVEHGARVINLSVGGRTPTQAEQDAIDYAVHNNVLVVVASGNKGINTTNYSPAGLKNVLTVAAIGPDLKRQPFSNWGATIGIAAPGVDILSLRARQTDLLQLMRDDYKREDAVVEGKYYRLTGSSFAAPMVAGAASLLLSVNPKLTAVQVQRMLTQSARDIDGIGMNQFSGYGLLDVEAALAADPNAYVQAGIANVAVAQVAGKTVVRVSGTADADNLKEAHIEIGQGENPSQWKAVSRPLTKPVVNGVLADLPADTFRGGKEWTLRVVVTGRKGKREARFKLTLG